MTRDEQIRNAAKEVKATLEKHLAHLNVDDFRIGAKWADENPANPWISVEERLPDNNQVVLAHHEIIIDGGGEHKEDENVTIQMYVGKWITDRMEQQRMGKWLFDITDRVTHWMPIPSLKRDDNEEDIDDPRLTEKQKKELGYK